MTGIRSRLAVCVVALLSWQVASAVAAPLVLCFATAPTHDELMCTCPDTPGGVCPMHHDRQAPSDGTGGSRWCDGRADAVDIVLTMTGGPLGVPPVALAAIAPAPSAALSWSRSARLVSIDTPPVSPPPRS